MVWTLKNIVRIPFFVVYIYMYIVLLLIVLDNQLEGSLLGEAYSYISHNNNNKKRGLSIWEGIGGYERDTGKGQDRCWREEREVGKRCNYILIKNISISSPKHLPLLHFSLLSFYISVKTISPTLAWIQLRVLFLTSKCLEAEDMLIRSWYEGVAWHAFHENECEDISWWYGRGLFGVWLRTSSLYKTVSHGKNPLVLVPNH